ncbi:uncharacterized protein YecE (DUF72 family) [Pelomonas aquatica]|uniref:Uncharacterized protein YecE (DUF72 family) n=1 Tax=Pelomonas aquatica TaxID=431058 RepID=A0ABU1Z2A9_9BURK|nr:DUF72 domain-containing protein [Pelomonas aquatica]MDR7294754.1 uncharacterized protein YecE (DUF72 family) [Pelomonas aquatica]
MPDPSSTHPAPARAFIGTAGWSIPAAVADRFPAEGSQLQRYAAVMNGVEINSSFHRSHRPQTYERWAASTPAHFRFAVKCPKQISHEARLDGVQEALARFVGEAGALGRKWTVLLVQLPPSLACDARVAGRFFEQARAAYGGAIVCEPRHASWFTPEAVRMLRDHGIARAGVDPAKWPGADEPVVHRRLAYCRWHGSPRLYWSPYEEDWLRARLASLQARPKSAACWCIFDNTASGAALHNALELQAMLA